MDGPWKTNAPPVPPGRRRLWLHLFPNQDALARYAGKDGRKNPDFDEPWEPHAFTDDVDDNYQAPRPRPLQDAPFVGDVVVTQHEGRHIFLTGPDEDGVPHDNDEHHNFPVGVQRVLGPDGRVVRRRLVRRPTCSVLGLCVGSGKTWRILPVHHGGFTGAMARQLLKSARSARPDPRGVRHGYLDVAEHLILRAEA